MRGDPIGLQVTSVVGEEQTVTSFADPGRRIALGPMATVTATDGETRVEFRDKHDAWRVGDRLTVAIRRVG